MSPQFFFLFLCSISLVRGPLTLVLLGLAPFFPWIKKRIEFEKKNQREESSRSFLKDKLRADYCLEVSSEGELEQVRGFITFALEKKQRLEIIYSSPSVEKKCLELHAAHSELIRLLRLPFITGFFGQRVDSWVSAPLIIFCRYDFFPELLLLKKRGVKFILFSGAFKKMSWYKRQAFRLFDTVVAATELEKKNFKSLFEGEKKKVYSCDFRVPRIAERLASAEETLERRLGSTGYWKKLKQIKADQKIVIGSAWPSDLAILNHPELKSALHRGELHLTLVPHQLTPEMLTHFESALGDFFGPSQVEILREGAPYQGAPVVVLWMSGLLCELYSAFSLAYVGGGYERSIHSVLEPFFAGNIVAMGPKVSRSTEFDLAWALAPGEIHVLKRPESFYTIMKRAEVDRIDLAARERWLAHTQKEMNTIVHEIADYAQ